VKSEVAEAPENRRVIVVGAGPVGLTAAEEIVHHGIPVVLLEAEGEPNREWRASTFHAATLELLEPLGISEGLVRLGIPARYVHFIDSERGVYARFDHQLIAGDTRYPYRLQCPQSTYGRFLADRLARNPLAELRFQHRVFDLEQDASGVTARCETPRGEERVRGAYLIAADGARSAVRKVLGVDFPGYTYEERILLMGTSLDFRRHLPDIADVDYVSEPDGYYMILHVPEAWRLIFNIDPDGPVDEEAVLRRMRRILGVQGGIPVVERMAYHFHQRVAERFYDGRVVLVGDAAHVNSPFGGLGMNSGIHDAVDLGRRLARIMGAAAADAERELRTYEQSRRAVAIRWVRSITEQNTQRLQWQDPERRRRLQDELAATAADPQRARQWLLQSTLLASVREQGIGVPPADA
jgi:2-polyprenyl-6-methoxyphenol hydroxylase-like FAD-dependent oxidoreductase